MSLRRLALALTVSLLPFAAVPGRAEAASFDLGLLRTGMPLAELRQGAWPAGSRLLCGGDPDLPAKVAAPRRDGITLPPNLAGRGIVLCSLFSADADGTWTERETDFAGMPAQLWVMTLAETEGAEPRLVQAKLWQPGAAFDTTAAFVTARLGPADAANKQGAHWRSADGEVIIGHLTSFGIVTTVTDTRLEAVVKERISPKPVAKP